MNYDIKNQNLTETKLKYTLDAYNKLEKLFKTSQMVQHTFHIPVLNEYRYLSRALIDFYSSEDIKDREDALSKLQVAIAAAYNDIIDSLLIAIKDAIDTYYTQYPFVNTNEVLKKYNISKVKQAIVAATKVITNSRGERADRFQAYENFSSSPEYEELINFGLSLHMIEYELNLLNNRSQDSQNSELFEIINSAFENYYKKTENYPKFELEFQPKYNSDKKIVGAEALIRLYLKSKEKLHPLIFLYIIQNSNKHKELDLLVLEKAVEAIEELSENKTLPESFDLSINVMPNTLTQDYTYIETFNNLINEKESILKNRLSLEIIESWDSENDEHIKIHYRLAQLISNTKIAIDDFGTGSTKLEYMAMIDHLHSIKIDKRLVDSLLTNNKEKALSLIQGIINLAKAVDLQIFIEGVENEEQFILLKNLNENLYYQGYYLNKPMSLDKFAKLLN